MCEMEINVFTKGNFRIKYVELFNMNVMDMWR